MSIYSVNVNLSDPYQAILDDIMILIMTSGQGMEEMLSQTSYADILSCMEATLKWRHILPHAPETVACKVFTETDPFVLDSMPHVYFTATLRRFTQKSIKIGESEIVMFTVPSFHNSSNVVLLNSQTLELETISF